MWITKVNSEILHFGIFSNDIIIAIIIRFLFHNFFMEGSPIAKKEFNHGLYRVTLLLVIIVTLIFNGILAYNTATQDLFSYTYRFPLFTILALLYGTIESSYDHFYIK